MFCALLSFPTHACNHFLSLARTLPHCCSTDFLAFWILWLTKLQLHLSLCSIVYALRVSLNLFGTAIRARAALDKHACVAG